MALTFNQASTCQKPHPVHTSLFKGEALFLIKGDDTGMGASQYEGISLRGVYLKMFFPLRNGSGQPLNVSILIERRVAARMQEKLRQESLSDCGRMNTQA